MTAEDSRFLSGPSVGSELCALEVFVFVVLLHGKGRLDTQDPGLEVKRGLPQRTSFLIEARNMNWLGAPVSSSQVSYLLICSIGTKICS